MTQNERIIRHLECYGTINAAQALREYGIMRLAARINDLRKTHNIETEMVSSINRFGEPVRFAKYSLKQGQMRLF